MEVTEIKDEDDKCLITLELDDEELRLIVERAVNDMIKEYIKCSMED